MKGKKKNIGKKADDCRRQENDYQRKADDYERELRNEASRNGGNGW